MGARARNNPVLTVLLPLRNGARFLPEQLHSLARQSLPPHHLIVSDDGSSDGSPDIVSDFARTAPFAVTLMQGPRLGLAHNVCALIRAAPSGMLAFCDQDDVWLPDRLAQAQVALASAAGPALHVSARIVTNAALGHRGYLPPPRTTGFANALVQNAAPANATVLNAAAGELLRRMAPKAGHMPYFPDWFIYALVTGAGGHVRTDPRAGLLYRQHGANVLGAALGPRAALRRARCLFNGRYGGWLRAHLTALDDACAALTPRARAQLDAFHATLDAGGPARLATARHGMGQNTLLRIAARLGCL